MRSSAWQIHLILSLLFIGITSSAAGSSKNTSAMQGKTSLKNSEKNKKADGPFSFGLSYLFVQDQNQNRPVKTSKHNFEIFGDYSLSESVQAGLSSTVIWTADGKNVKKTEDNPRWEDLDLQLSYSKELESAWSYNIAVSDALPTGYESRTEGVRNTIGTQGTISKGVFAKKLNFSATAGASYIWQTYDMSVTTGESNPDSLYTGKIAASYKLMDSLSMGASYTLWSFHFINGENNLARNQAAASIKYSFKNFVTTASFSLGNYDKSDGYKFLFVDDTRQIISLGVAFEI